jgi:hypothetical protein
MQYHYVTVQNIYRVTAVQLVHSRGKMAVPPEVTAVQLHKVLIDIKTNCSVVSTW